jgi:hypothetical protein
MGGLKISEEFGDKYRDWLDNSIDNFQGIADLCAAFFRRAFDALNANGIFGLIATNSISQGDTRLAGLAQIVRCGGMIRFAHRFVKWPGRANVEVNLICSGKLQANSKPLLDSKAVEFISSRLDEEPEAEPATLHINLNKAFQGDVVRGAGFLLETAEAQALLHSDELYRECVLPYLAGEDFNDRPDQHPSRFVVCFHDWSYERASNYKRAMDIVRTRVKPERDRVKQKSEREKWWLFGRYRGELRRATRGLSRYLTRTLHSEFHMIDLADSGWIAGHAMAIFAFDDFFHFAVLQSNIHEAWVWKNGSSLESRSRYTPTDCFETFAFPQIPREAARAEAERSGKSYHEHRHQTMLVRQLGLTKTYNLFHKRECSDADIARLRELHAEIDRAILVCYCWTDIDPGHGFYQNERGHTRYTISPTARREILRRLLALNLEIAAREAVSETPRRRRG